MANEKRAIIAISVVIVIEILIYVQNVMKKDALIETIDRLSATKIKLNKDNAELSSILNNISETKNFSLLLLKCAPVKSINEKKESKIVLDALKNNKIYVKHHKLTVVDDNICGGNVFLCKHLIEFSSPLDVNVFMFLNEIDKLETGFAEIESLIMEKQSDATYKIIGTLTLVRLIVRSN